MNKSKPTKQKKTECPHDGCMMHDRESVKAYVNSRKPQTTAEARSYAAEYHERKKKCEFCHSYHHMGACYEVYKRNQPKAEEKKCKLCVLDDETGYYCVEHKRYVVERVDCQPKAETGWESRIRNKYQASYKEAEGLLPKEVTDWLIKDIANELERQRAGHDKCKVRFEILLGRMRACEEEHPDTHRVSLKEIPAWIEELQAIQEEKE